MFLETEPRAEAVEYSILKKESIFAKNSSLCSAVTSPPG
jgi:hypothetical protein